MKKCDISRLGAEDLIRDISQEYMLVAAGTPDRYNMMTASWGGVGYLWGQPVTFVFIRPERFTFEFVEREPRFTLSFLGNAHRDILAYCGSHSGRDGDKAAATGLKAVATELGSVAFEQARLTLECRKLYRTELRPEEFLDRAPLERWYGDRPGGSLHAVYVAAIENVYE